MTEENSRLLNEHIDILSLRDLSPGTIATYSSYMRAFIEWLESPESILSAFRYSMGRYPLLAGIPQRRQEAER